MSDVEVLHGVSLEEAALSVDELAKACAVEHRWVVERVEAGLLSVVSVTTTTEMRFASPELIRARRLHAMERDFDANPELAALTVDLIEEVERLKRLLGRAGAG